VLFSGVFMMAIRLLSTASAATITTIAALMTLTAPAAAQIGTPPVPSGQFRSQTLPQQAPTQQAPTQLAPAPVRPVAPTPTHAAESAAPLARPAIYPAPNSPLAEPTYDEGTLNRIAEAWRRYDAIASQGGWPVLARTARLERGQTGPDVAIVRRHLAITGDLPAQLADGDAYDDALVAAVRHYQARNGLSETGSVGAQTAAELAVPVEKRIRALASSYDRLSNTAFTFGQRYVVVNLPAAAIEAVANGQVERRYVAVVGKVDRPSPTVTTHITNVNINPTWTVPLSIAKKDIVPKLRKDPGYLARMHMKLLDAAGREIDPGSVDWNSDRALAFTFRQDPGPWNALGVVRIDMPNPYSVYMHDTNHRNLFSADYRFQSSGCTRVSDPRDLAAWVLQDAPGWNRARFEAAVASSQRIDVRLAHNIPVAWIYLTAWMSRDGNVHFRPDIYRQDDAPTRPFMVQLPKPVVTAARNAGFSLQSGESHAEGAAPQIAEVSYLDSQ
jgi:murein L,D-transpeptidase YcbB/YkuD